MNSLISLFLNISLLLNMQPVDSSDRRNIYIFDDSISIEEARNLSELAELIIFKVRSKDRIGMSKLFTDSPESNEFGLEARWEAVEDDVISRKIFDGN